MKLLVLPTLLSIFFLAGISPAFSQEEQAEELEKKLQKTTEDTARVNLLNDISFEYYSPDPVKSKTYADEALKLAQSLNYEKGVAVAYRNIGNFFWTQGSFDKALEYQFQSLRILEKLGHSKETARTHNSIGLVYRDLKNYDLALGYFTKAWDIYKNFPDKVRVGIIHNNIGGVLVRKGNLDEAVSHLLKANKLFKEKNNQQRIATNYNNIGYLYIQKGNPALALTYLNDAYNIDSALKDRSRMAQNLNGIAEAYKARKEYKKAIYFYNKALNMAKEIGLKEEIKNTYRGIASVHEENKDYQQAYNFYQLYHAFYDSIFNETSTRKIRQLEAIYDSEKKQVEIDLLTKNRLLQQAELQKERIIRNSLIGAFIAVAVIAFILFLTIGQKQKINKQLQEQKTEIQNKNEDLLFKNIEITHQKDEIAVQRDDIRSKTEELEVALAEINKQKEALEQLNATKDKFFSIVAHDIKSPLDSLSAFASLLANYIDNMSKEEIQTIATNLDQSVKNTLQLTENLLTWARSQMNSLSYNPAVVNVNEVINQKISLFNLIAQNKKISFTTNLSPDALSFVDENHLRFVLRNLISNALKFTMPGGTIIIETTEHGGELEVSIKDDGVGISSEVLSKIFRIDTKVSTRGTSGEKGTGLGLLLCKEFIEKNNGKIKVESEVAKGSRFSFTLRRAEVLV